MSNETWNKFVAGDIEFGKFYVHHNKIPKIKRIEFWDWALDDTIEMPCRYSAKKYYLGKEVTMLPAILQSIEMVPSSIYGDICELPMLTYLHPLKIKSIPNKTFGFLDSFQPIGNTVRRSPYLFLLEECLLEETKSYKITTFERS
jgi:hypothetical protein